VADFFIDTEIIDASGHLTADVTDAWMGFGPNGGYLSAIALRAAGTASALDYPVSFTVNYLNAAKPGSVELTVRILRQSTRSESIAVDMHQDSMHVLTALVRTASQATGFAHVHVERPLVPPPMNLASWEDLVPPEERMGLPMETAFEMRPVTWVPEWPPPKPRDPRTVTWVRFRPVSQISDPFGDAGRSLVLIDSFIWPCLQRAHYGDPGLAVRSVDLAVLFHGRHQPGEWLLADAVSPVAANGVSSGIGRVFDGNGHPIASGITNLVSVA
jgi:acyl-CoA thioesterase